MEAQWGQVLLTEDIVEVHAGARHDDARSFAVRGGYRACPAVGVEHGNVRG